MDNANKLINVLIDLLERKKLLFDEILGITVEQKKDIEENDANDIEVLINRKQIAIDSIDEIDRSFTEGFEQLKQQLNISKLEEVDHTKYPLLRSLKEKTGDIMTQAQSIMKIEEYNKEQLSLKLYDIKKEMKHLSVGKKSIRAYETPAINNDGIYIDKKK